MNYPKPIFIPETISTNTLLAEMCNKEHVLELTSIYTAYQTSGRGQRGNGWESEAGANLLFSFVVYPTFLEANRQFLLSQITALALYKVLSQYTDHISIKWPNDIYWKDKKLCGTLIENDLTGTFINRSISGTGINLNQEKFVSNAPNPISLKQITHQNYDPYTILIQSMQWIAHYYTLLKSGKTNEIITSYQTVLYRKNGFYPYQDKEGIFYARICNVEENGKLILEDEKSRKRTYLFKEVSFVL
ncbi:MAG TPA: biotin--[acetyl-CoA-carboxylase] ligase [Candidatus Phocaeicola gallistercoris]|nr:biotin--[acetyl-CoA-carboxylase] ligase [Candidatus Phocaeicola gallistercoris]